MTSPDSLAAAAFNSGDFDKAVRLYRELQQAQPDNPQHYFNLALAQSRLGQTDATIATLNTTINTFNTRAEVWHRVGTLLLSLGQTIMTYGMARKAVELFPADVSIRILLGDSQFTGKINDLGQEDYELVLAQLRAEDGAAEAEAHVLRQLLQVYFSNEEEGKFQHLLDELLADESSDLALARTLAEYLGRARRLEDMATVLERALNIHPEDFALLTLSAIARLRSGDTAGFETLAEQLVSGNDGKQFKYYLGLLHSELGRHCDHNRQYDRAFEHYSRMNRITVERAGGERTIAQLIEQDFNILRAWADLTGDFAQEFNNTPIDPGDPEPVFFVGFPRSGTTLVDQILGAHPEIGIIEEKPLLDEVCARLQRRLGGYPTRSILDLPAEETAELQKLYLQRVEQDCSDASVKIDKMPLNLKHLPLILRLFPRAKILVAIRHPLDCVLSCYFQQFAMNQSMAHFTSLASAARYYAAVMDNYLAAEKAYNTQFCTFRYEDIVADLRVSANNILEYLGLAWHDNMGQHTALAAQKAIIKTPSQEQVQRPLYSDSIERWKHYEKYLQDPHEILAPYLSHFGYSDTA